MQYNLSINQRALVDNGLFPSLDAVSFLIVMQSATNSTAFQKKAMKDKDRIWYWFSPSYFETELPLIFIKKKRGEIDTEGRTDKAVRAKIYRTIKELEEWGLVDIHPENQARGAAYYSFTDLAYNLSTSTKNEEANHAPLHEKRGPPSTKNVDNHYTNNHSTSLSSYEDNTSRPTENEPTGPKAEDKEHLNTSTTKKEIIREKGAAANKVPSKSWVASVMEAFDEVGSEKGRTHGIPYDDIRICWSVNGGRYAGTFAKLRKAVEQKLKASNRDTTDENVVAAFKGMFCASYEWAIHMRDKLDGFKFTYTPQFVYNNIDNVRLFAQQNPNMKKQSVAVPIKPLTYNSAHDGN